MARKIETCVMFDVPNDTTADEFMEILKYVRSAVEAWRYSAGTRMLAVRKMSNITVTGLTDVANYEQVSQ